MRIKYLLIAILVALPLKMVQIVYSPSNATDPSFHVDKPDGTAASGLSATMEVTVTQ